MADIELLTQLRQLLSKRFSDGELRTLCFDLGVAYEDLPGAGKADKARELVDYMDRYERLADLLRVGRGSRPDVPWPEVFTVPGKQTLPPQGTPLPSINALRREAKEQQLADLMEEYRAANRQLGSALGEVERVRLGRQMADLETKIQALEAELTQLKSGAEVKTPSGPGVSPAPRRSLRVFLSHASEDKAQVREVYRKLLAQGIDAWLDEEELLPGQDWRLEIRKAVRSSDVVLTFLSQRAVTKTGYVQKEIKQALDVADEQPEGAIFLIPVKLEACDTPDRLSHVQWVNLYEESGWID